MEGNEVEAAQEGGAAVVWVAVGVVAAMALAGSAREEGPARRLVVVASEAVEEVNSVDEVTVAEAECHML